MPTDPQDTPRLLGEISQGPSAFEQFLDRNQKNLIILCIAIALATAAYLVYQGIANSKERSAGADLCKAEDLASLQTLIKDYPGTAAAGTAEIALADRQWADGQQGTAIETLKAFLSANPKHPARQTAKASLAAKLKDQGKAAEATPIFQELADDPEARFLAPYALLSLGDLAKNAGNLDQAEKSYQKAKSILPGNSFANTIDQRLANLKTKAPVEIDPPPAPPATPAPPTATPGAPNAATAPGTPAIPGLPPADKDSSETDVPPLDITNPGGIPAPTPMPADEPAEKSDPQPAPPVQEPPPAPRSDTPPPPATPPAGSSTTP